MINQTVRQLSELNLGFPNKFVVPIHRKNGYDVREDYKIMMLPLIPSKVVTFQTGSGIRGLAMKLVSRLAEPLAWLWRRRQGRRRPASAQILESPDPEGFAAIFRQYRDGFVTTNRSAEYIHWRYIESPYRAQYAFFTGGSGPVPSVVVICRTLLHNGVKVTRVLDIFGDMADRKGLKDLLRVVVREAIRQGASQITAMATLPSLMSILRSNGFFLSVPCRFCYYSRRPDLMRIFREHPCHWVLADSDNDTVD